MKKIIYTCSAIISIGLCTHSIANTEAPNHKYSNWNEDAVKKHIEQAQNGDIESTNALIHYYRNYNGGNDHEEALRWLTVAREQIQSSSLGNADKSEKLAKIDRLIEHEKASIARLSMSEEELKPYIEKAQSDDYRSILALCSYYEHHQQFDKAIYWLKRARELTSQRSANANPMDIVRQNRVEEQYPDEQSAKAYAEQVRKDILEHFDSRIKKVLELKDNSSNQSSEPTSTTPVD